MLVKTTFYKRAKKCNWFSCIKAFAPAASLLQAQCPSLVTFVLSHLPHTLHKHNIPLQRKKKFPLTPVDELCLCVRLRQGNNTCLYTTETQSQNSSFLSWIVVNEETLFTAKTFVAKLE